jgi:hypothetical protein
LIIAPNKSLDASGGSVNSLLISNCRLPIEFAPPRQLNRYAALPYDLRVVANER